MSEFWNSWFWMIFWNPAGVPKHFKTSNLLHEKLQILLFVLRSVFLFKECEYQGKHILCALVCSNRRKRIKSGESSLTLICPNTITIDRGPIKFSTKLSAFVRPQRIFAAIFENFTVYFHTRIRTYVTIVAVIYFFFENNFKAE
jgi:hypothetical protein